MWTLILTTCSLRIVRKGNFMDRPNPETIMSSHRTGNLGFAASCTDAPCAAPDMPNHASTDRSRARNEWRTGLAIFLRAVMRHLRLPLPDTSTPNATLIRHNELNKAWASALPRLSHLDAHVLRDIGAPPWVISEIARRQHRVAHLHTHRYLRDIDVC